MKPLVICSPQAAGSWTPHGGGLQEVTSGPVAGDI